MKKLVLILLLAIGMSLSFAAIGLVMLFALDVVENLEQVRALLTGTLEGGESTVMQPGELFQVQEALTILQQQKQELERDLQDLSQERETILQENAVLLDTVAVRQERSQVGSQDLVQARIERLNQLVILYGAMRPADAAAILDGLSADQDDLILDILTRLQPRLAARILNGLGDDARKAKLSTLLVQGTTARQ